MNRHPHYANADLPAAWRAIKSMLRESQHTQYIDTGEALEVLNLAADTMKAAIREIRGTDFDRQQVTHTCGSCGSEDVEVCMPAWFKARGYELRYVECDEEAEALNTHCNACEENQSLTVQPHDLEELRTLTGRWSIALQESIDGTNQN
jgi:hypothetical protein